MGLGQYDGLGEYCDPHTASSVFLILIFQILFGTPYGSSPEKTVPADELSRALNFDSIMDFRVGLKINM